MKKIFKIIILSMLFTMLFSVSAFAAENNESGETNAATEVQTRNSYYKERMYAETTVVFDSNHYVIIRVYADVSYSWVDGVYGIIEDMDVLVDDGSWPVGYPYLSDIICYNMYVASGPMEMEYGLNNNEDLCFQKYDVTFSCFTASGFTVYSGRISVYASVDEWGEADFWVSYEHM